MASSKLSDFYYEKKRIAHRPGSKHSGGAGRSTLSAEDERNNELKTLKEFDLNQDYGPCIGITRLERWERAQRHELNPSLEIKDLIQSHLDDKEYTESVWHSYSNLI